MNEFFDIVENYLRSGNAEQAFTLLQQVNDSSERCIQLTNECHKMLENQYMTQIQQGLASGDNTSAQAAIDQFRAKLGSNPTIDALAAVITSQQTAQQAAQPTPEPVASPTPQPVPEPVMPPAPEVVPPTPEPTPVPVVPPTPQPVPEPVMPPTPEVVPPTPEPAPIPVVPPTPQPVPEPVMPPTPEVVPPTPEPIPAPVVPPTPQPVPEPVMPPAPAPAPQFAPQSAPTYGSQPVFAPEQPAKTKKKSKKGLWITLAIIALLLIGGACSYFFIDPVKKFVNNTLGIASDTTAVVDSTAVKASPDEYEDEDDGDYEDEDEWETEDEDLGEDEGDDFESIDDPKPEDFPGGLADDGLGPDEDEYGNPKTQPTIPQTTPQPTTQPDPQPVATGPAPKGEPTSREFSNMMSYLRNNTRSIGTTGRVNVEFVVEANGTCSNVRVTRGLNAAANSEAVRLIQNMRIGNSSGRRYTYSAFIDFR